jgi:uncharacterized delta-60 repeat protein
MTNLKHVTAPIVLAAALASHCFHLNAQSSTPGNVDLSFNPGTGINGFTGATGVGVQSDGRVIVSGTFTDINGAAITNFARLNNDGGVDTFFHPAFLLANFLLIAPGHFLILPDDRSLVTGAFDHVNGIEMDHLARLDTQGNLDQSFANPGLGVNDGGFLARGAGDRILVRSLAGPGVHRVLANGTPDATFNLGNVLSAGYVFAEQPDGKLVVAGLPVGGTEITVVRFNANGTQDGTFQSPTFDPVLTGYGVRLALQPDGKILVCGSFTNVNGFFRGSIVRLNTNGVVDTSFVPGNGGIGATWLIHPAPGFTFAFARSINAVALQNDGKILIGGDFFTFNDTAAAGIARLNSNGSLDTSFNVGSGTTNVVTPSPGNVSSIAIASDGKVVIGGLFDHVNGVPRKNIARLNGNPVAPMAPTIVTQPISQSVIVGSVVNFSVGATGTPPLSYQWRKDGANISGATAASLALSNVQTNQSGNYTVVVRNSAGSVTSVVAVLTVTIEPTPPFIATEPADLTVVGGQTAVFTVSAGGTTPLRYQWIRNDSNLPGRINPTLVLSNAQPANAGEYRVVVMNALGAVTSRVATLTVILPPGITMQPTNVSARIPAPITTNELNAGALAGKILRMTIKAGAAPFPASGTYDIVLAAAGNTYSIPPGGAMGSSAGSWTFGPDLGIDTVLNLSDSFPGGGPVHVALLTDGTFEMYADGVVNDQSGTYVILTSTGAPIGPTVSFHVAAPGTEPLSYQWLFNGNPVADSSPAFSEAKTIGPRINPLDFPAYSGAQTATLTIRRANASAAGKYSVTISNVAGRITSSNAVLSINGSSTADTTRPTLVVTSPSSATTRLTSNTVTFAGTANDPSGIAGVFIQQGNGAFLPAVGRSMWSATGELAPGTNVFRIRARDFAGNDSLTNTKVVVFIVTSPLTLTIHGAGTVTGATNGQALEIGKSYTLKAVPATGNIFNKWTGDITSTNPALTFLMRSNVSLRANFITNRFIALKGVYNGLFYDPNNPAHANAGFVNLSLTDKGKFTGKLLSSMNRYALSGQFDSTLVSAQTITRTGTNELRVSLQLTETSDVLLGSVSNAAFFSPLLAHRATFSTAHPVANAPLKYTMLLSGGPEPVTSPFGQGFATLTLASAGSVTIKGTLADGTTISQTVPVSTDGQVPFYVALYGGKGSIFGWLALDDTTTNDIAGHLVWTKPGGVTGAFYRGGFTNEVETLGSIYTPPPSGSPALNLANGVVLLEGGNLTMRSMNNVTLDLSNKVTVTTTNANRLVLTLSVSSGTMSGSFFNSGTAKSSAIKGVLLQKANADGGFFLGTNQSGMVFFGKPEDFPLFAP